jgi:hypothetical protein
MWQVTTEKVDDLWLVIHTGDLKVHREGQFDDRKFVSGTPEGEDEVQQEAIQGLRKVQGRRL